MKIGKRYKLRQILLPTVDILIIIFAHLSALTLRYEYGLVNLCQHIANKIPVLLVVIIVHIIMFMLFRINKSLWEYVSVDEALLIVGAIITADFFVFMYFAIEPKYTISNSVMIIALIFSIVGMLGVRIIYRYLRLQKRMMLKSERAVIIGAGSGGNLLHKEIMNNDNYPTKIVGFVDDDLSKKGHMIDGYPIIGTTDQLLQLKQNYKFTTAFIAIPSASKRSIKRIIDKCQKAELKTRIMEISDVSNQSQIREVSIDDLLGRGEVRLDDSSISQYLKHKRILVTGAGGSIGSELCRQVIKYQPESLIM
ncbi:MAG: polysaccharide biosynthesis protein, partial [Erysipelotrichaceae bacterium]|nr:polysaccharide biosynthesis protein [Erysipelotrichaceae bacterium]